MAQIKAKSFSRGGTAVDVDLKALLTGEIGIAEFGLVKALKGQVFGANFGTITTPITFTNTGNIDVTKAAAAIIVPTGTTIIPMSISLQMEAYGTNAIFECGASLGTGGSRTSGMTSVTPSNIRADFPSGSACLAWTGDNTTVTVGQTTNKLEFWRDGLQVAITHATAVNNIANADTYKFKWSASEMIAPPIGVGPCQLFVNVASQAPTGFIIVTWVEVPSSDIPA